MTILRLAHADILCTQRQLANLVEMQRQNRRARHYGAFSFYPPGAVRHAIGVAHLQLQRSGEILAIYTAAANDEPTAPEAA